MTDTADDDDLRPEYPPALIRSGVRGKYAKRYRDEDETLLFLCQVCGSTEGRQKHVSEVFVIDGKYVFVEDIPATICVRCSEAAFSRETTERIRLIVRGESEPVRTEVMDVFKYG